MIFVNSWLSGKKQWSKVLIKVRIGKITLFDFYADFPKKQFGLILFNFGLKRGTANTKEL